MAESHLDFTRPSHVVGRYALYGRLAAGGMATVHLGRLMEADGSSRTVAVKRLHPQFCKDPEFVAMFIDEARLAARIKHPNVVETLDILTMGQELLLVMEYIRGECFSKLLRAARRKNLEPSIGVVGRIASGMLHGLHAAHDAKDDQGEPLNVVHRDVSPQNVMIDAAGMVKVLDFGVAKASARIQITRDGQMKGKLSYMSPEQLQGLAVDRRADVFACGVVLWEALTRRRLFVGEDASEVLRKILRDEVPPPSEWVPGLTPDIDRVVLRALSKDPEQRYQTALELAQDIEQIIELAPDHEVGAWLDSVAGEILGKRERLLAEIERSGPIEFSFGAGDATSGLAARGSLTESDTFQRIQSWAEREAARVASDSSHPPLPSQPDESELEPTRTVADARCVAGSEAPPPLEDPSSAREFDVTMSDGEEPESAVTLAEDPSFAASEREALAASQQHAAGARAAVSPGAFAQGTIGLVEGSRRSGRRLLVAMAAAAAFLGLAVVAIVGVEPSDVSTKSGTLMPEHAAPKLPAAEALPPGSAAPSQAERSSVARAEPSGGTVAPASQREHPEPVAAASNETSKPAAVVADPPEAPSTDSARVAQAQPATERAVQTAPNKRSVRRSVAPRRRAAAPLPKTASKVDCRQPFWIDEAGIRRIKMACL